MAQLINIAETNGMYDNVPVDASTELSVELSSLSITKEANKKVWVSGNLEYTIIVTNIYVLDPDDPDSGLPVSDISITDTIDRTIATLVTNSVRINGTTAIEDTDYTFDAENGILTIISLTDLAAGEFHTITFQVSMV